MIDAASSSSILVVSPALCLTVACLVLCTEVGLHVLAPWMLSLATTTVDERAQLAATARRLHALRLKSNQLNSPATFAEYAKVQRALNKELKDQQQLQDSIARRNSASGGLQAMPAVGQAVLTYALKFAVYALCFFLCWGRTLFVVPCSGWMAPLNFTPLRLVIGEVGVVPWLAICSFASTSIKAWL